ncbi:MAG: hypothetical protein AAF629_29515 [Chloroflexota bacterium]
MCTIKANLPVALLRTGGTEASTVQVLVLSGFIKSRMPDDYRPTVRPTIRHWFAAMKLDGNGTAVMALFLMRA